MDNHEQKEFWSTLTVRGNLQKIILIIGILCFIPNLSFAGDKTLDRKQIYELQERCGKRAAELFKQEYGNGLESNRYALYTDHYNGKLNKFFCSNRKFQ